MAWRTAKLHDQPKVLRREKQREGDSLASVGSSSRISLSIKNTSVEASLQRNKSLKRKNTVLVSQHLNTNLQRTE